MQKVYLLLRNNQQTGPYSLEELLQKSLQSFDLIWVEGKSAGWRYPAEIETLQPYVTATDTPPPQTLPTEQTQAASTIPLQPTNKKIFVSMPVGNSPATPIALQTTPIQATEQELKHQAYWPKAEEEKTAKEPAAQTKYTRTLNDVEEEYTNWMYQKKTKKKKTLSPQQSAVLGLLVVVIIGGGYAVKQMFFKEAAASITTPAAYQPVQPNGTDKTAITTTETNEPETPLPQKKTAQKQVADKSVAKNETTKAEAETSTKPLKDLTKQQPVATEEETVPEDDKAVAIAPEEKSTPVTTAPQTKKKTLAETINNLFKKKNEQEETTHPSVDNDGGVRKSKHRGDEEEQPADAAPTTIDLTDQVQLKSNQAQDNWMMGVQGMKLTLYNRSNTTVKAAVAEVSYYSDQSRLLAIKTITFSNIGAKKSQTVAVPDMRMADHADVRLVSATGEQQALAKQ